MGKYFLTNVKNNQFVLIHRCSNTIRLVEQLETDAVLGMNVDALVCYSLVLIFNEKPASKLFLQTLL